MVFAFGYSAGNGITAVYKPNNKEIFYFRTLRENGWLEDEWILYNNVPPFYPLSNVFKDNFRTVTNGSTVYGSYISTVRTEEAGIEDAIIYGAGLAYGARDTHGYLMIAPTYAHAVIGGGNTDRLCWTRELAFRDENTFGTHNKPKGSYTGNGSAATRTIQVGGTGLLLMQNSGFTVLIGNAGAIILEIDGNSRTLPQSKVRFEQGILTINTDDIAINMSGHGYYYELL